MSETFDEMIDIIFSIDPAKNYFYFFFLVATALFFEIFLYLAMRKPHLRRIRPKTFLDVYELPISNRCSVIAGLVIAAPLIVYAYVDNWQHFYCISQDEEQLYVHYLFPKRTTKISDINGLQITTQYEVRRGASYRIKIGDADRREYTSQVMERSDVDTNLVKLNAAIRQYRAKGIKRLG